MADSVDGTIDGDEEFTAALTEIGSLPRSVPKTGNEMYGVMYSEKPSRSYNDNQNDSAVLLYYLNGTEQDCGLNRVADDWGDSEVDAPLYPSGDPWTVGDYQDSGKTMCVISIPG